MVGFYNSQCTCIYVSQGSSDIKLEIKFEIDVVKSGPPSCTVRHRPAPSCPKYNTKSVPSNRYRYPLHIYQMCSSHVRRVANMMYAFPVRTDFSQRTCNAASKPPAKPPRVALRDLRL